MGGSGGGRSGARRLLQGRVGSAWGHSIAALLVLAPATASAHAYLSEPEARTTASVSPGPCGDGPVTGGRTAYDPGETITVRWENQIPHYGTFHVRFSPNDDAGFEDGELLVVDDDPEIYDYEQSVTLPMCSCTDCTLQLWQVPGSGQGGYYSCADIELRVSADASPCPMAVPDEDPGGGTSDGTSGDDADPGDGDGGGTWGDDGSAEGDTGIEPDPGGAAEGDDAGVDPTFGDDAASADDGATSGDAESAGGGPGDDDARGCSIGARTPFGAFAVVVLVLGIGRRRSRHK